MERRSHAPTVPHALMRNARDHPDSAAFSFRTNEGREPLPWQELSDTVIAVGAGLMAEGGGGGRAIVVHSGNDEVSLLLDLAAQTIGDYVVPIYPRADQELIERVVRATDPLLVFTPDQVLRGRHQSIARPAEMQEIVRLHDRGTGTTAVKNRLEAVGDDTTALLTDASDTDEVPIAHLSHRLIAAQCRAVADAFDYRSSDLRYSLLPWAHVYERVQAVYGGVHSAIPTWVAAGYGTLLADLQDSRPTLFGGTSRVFQHLRGLLLLEALPGQDGRGATHLDDVQAGLMQATALSIDSRLRPGRVFVRWKPSNRRIQAAVRALLGGRVRALTSAFSPMDGATALFFDAVGLPIYEGYGHVKAGGLVSTNTPNAYRFGTLGRPLPDAAVQVDSTNRLHVRGPGMTETVATPELAQLTQKGLRDYVRVVGSDRARVSIRGINLSPTLEEAVVMSDPLVDQCAVVDERMQVVPNRSALEDWAWARRLHVSADALKDDDEVSLRLKAVSRRGVDIVDRLEPTTTYPSHVDEVEAALDDAGRSGVGLAGHLARRVAVDPQSQPGAGGDGP